MWGLTLGQEKLLRVGFLTCPVETRWLANLLTHSIASFANEVHLSVAIALETVSLSTCVTEPVQL